MPKTVPPPDARGAACGCDWTPSFAECLAKIFGMAPLSELQWRVISECREEWARSGEVPGLARLAAVANLSREELEGLFPGDSPGFPWILAGLTPPAEVARARSATALTPVPNLAGLPFPDGRSRGH